MQQWTERKDSWRMIVALHGCWRQSLNSTTVCHLANILSSWLNILPIYKVDSHQLAISPWQANTDQVTGSLYFTNFVMRPYFEHCHTVCILTAHTGKVITTIFSCGKCHFMLSVLFFWDTVYIQNQQIRFTNKSQ